MSDILIEIGEEMERRYPEHDLFYWMDYVTNGGKLPKDLEEQYGGL